MVSGACSRSGDEDEVSFAVSPLSGGQRPSLTSGFGPGLEADSQLNAVLQRVSWLEEQLAASQQDDRDAAGQCGRLQLKTPTQIDTTAAERTEAQLQRATAEAQRVEAAVRTEIGNTIAQARSFLDQEWIKHCTAPDGDSKVLMTRGQQARSTECLGVRIEALELHICGRLEALEDAAANSCKKPSSDSSQLEKVTGSILQEVSSMISNRMDVERKAIDSMINSFNAWQETADAMISTRLNAERLAAESMISSRLDAWQVASHSMLIDHLKIERAEREKSLEDVPSLEAITEHQQALARALGEELETSIVSQAVAEVRTAACQAAREEACAEIAELRGKVSDLVDHLEVSKRFSTTSTPPALSSGNFPVSSPARAETEHAFSVVGAPALHQFGESVTQLESNIKNLLESSVESRAEQKREHFALRGEIEQLHTQFQLLTSRDLPQVWEHLERLEALKRCASENVSLSVKPELGPSTQPSGTQTPLTVVPPPALPHWRLAVVPSPSRSPTRAMKAVSPGPSRHSGSSQPPNRPNQQSCGRPPRTASPAPGPIRPASPRNASPLMPSRRGPSPGSSASAPQGSAQIVNICATGDYRLRSCPET